MGGKTSTSTSQVSIPPEVLARYNSVNAQAQQVAGNPFQQYSTNPSAFVQPLDPTQQAGIANTNAAQGMAQPYYNAATGFAMAGAQPINAQPLDVGSYMNPYLNTVLGSTEALVNQQNQQAMAGQTGNAIQQGYFGGDRAGIAAAVLAGQQQLTGGQLYSGIASDAYNQALAAAQQQQGVNLGAAQANRAALQQTGESLAGLGTTAQGTALQGAQAQLGAGQIEQQTGQAGLTALYNQFLQQQSYPFQVAQFLANIAEGTGALSGSTTTTTQPQSIFSDERLKEDMVPVGVGFDGANIYRFRYKGDPTTRIGFSAQEMERLHPEAVHTHPSGFKMVDYGKATDAAAGFALAANDNHGDEARRARATGGRAGFDLGGITNDLPQPWRAEAGALENMPLPRALGLADGGRIARQGGGMSEWGMYPSGSNPMAISQILQAQAQMYGPYSSAGLYGGQGASGGPYGGVQGHVPAASLPVGQLMIAHPVSSPQQGGLTSDIHDVASLAGDAEGIKSDYHLAHEGYDKLANWFGGGGGGGMPEGGANRGGRIGRQAGGSTAADYAAQAHQAANEARIHAAAAAAHRDMAARQARDRAGYQMIGPQATGAGGAPRPGNIQYGGGGGGWDWGGIGHWLGQQTAAPSSIHPLYGGSPAAPAGGGAGGVNPTLLAKTAAITGDPGLARAAAIHNHVQQAHAHAQAAQALSAPTAAPTGGTSPNLRGAVGLPGNVAQVTPISHVGDLSSLQTGFAPANLQPYHEGLLARVGDWIGGHFGGDAQRMAYDARGMTPSTVQSAAFQDRSPDMGLTHEQWLAGNTPTTAPTVTPAVAHIDPQLAAAVPSSAVNTEPIQSEAFTRPRVDNLADSVDLPPQTAARGGFARADGGAAKNPWSAVVSGSSNLTSGRASRQGGGELSDPHNDDPYATPGPGLNIPTSETQHPQLPVAKPPGQGQGGLGQAVGMASDLANIGKFAMMFAANGGRIGRDNGGSTPDDPLTAASADAAPADAAAPSPPKQPGFGGAAQAPPDSQGGGGSGFLGSLFHGVENLGKGVAGMAGYEGDGHWNRDLLMPLLSAIGTAGSVPTVHPFVALAAGLGGYGKAYMAQQQAEQAMNLTKAQAMQAQQQAIPESIRPYVGAVPGVAMTPDGRFVDPSRTFTGADGKPYHYAKANEMVAGLGGAGQTGTAAATPQSQQGNVSAAGAPAGPVQADYSSGGLPRYTLGPSPQETARAQHLYGVNPNASGMDNQINRQFGNVRVTDDQIAAAGKNADLYDGSLNDATSTHRALLDSISQIQKLPETGPGAVGPGQEERQLALSSYNMMMRVFGLQGDPSIDQNTATTQILQKLSALQGAASAGQYGQHAASIAQQLSGVMPSGHMQKPAAYNLLSQMLVTNQQDRDFANYRAQYQRLGLGDYQALEAFHRDFDPMYAKETGQLQSLMARGPKGGPSVFEVLQQRPQDIQRLEQGWDDANGVHHKGLGYLGRYLQ